MALIGRTACADFGSFGDSGRLTGYGMGITVLLVLPAGGLPVVQLLAAFTLIGAGLGAASVASTQTGTDAADPAYRGVASGRTQLRRPGRDSCRRRTPRTPRGRRRRPGRHDGYRIGFLGASIALAGALSSLLVPVRPASDRKGSKVPTVITCSSSGVVAPKQDSHERE